MPGSIKNAQRGRYGSFLPEAREKNLSVPGFSNTAAAPWSRRAPAGTWKLGKIRFCEHGPSTSITTMSTRKTRETTQKLTSTSRTGRDSNAANTLRHQRAAAADVCAPTPRALYTCDEQKVVTIK